MKNSSNKLSCEKSQLNFLYLSDEILKIYASDGYFSRGKNIRTKMSDIIGYHLSISKDILNSISSITDLLHNASLVHDDIIDNDKIRRGQSSIWKKYGVGKAILVGDYLISKSYQEVALMNLGYGEKTKLNDEITKTLKDSVKGAHLELEHSDQTLETTFNNYIEISSLKTGSLFSLPFRCLYNMYEKFDSNEKKSLSKAFCNLAVSYQIKDDWLDFKSSKIHTGNNSDYINNRPNIFNIMGRKYTEDLEALIHRTQKDIILNSFNTIKCFNTDLFNDLKVCLNKFINFSI